MANVAKSNVPNLSNIFQRALDETIQEVGFAVVEEAHKTAPVDKGNYKKGISFDAKDKVIANVNYSATIEYGISNPVLIKPKTKKALHFIKDGKDVFVKYAQQKRRNPNPVMRNAARKVQKESGGLFLKNWNRLKASV